MLKSKLWAGSSSRTAKLLFMGSKCARGSSDTDFFSLYTCSPFACCLSVPHPLSTMMNPEKLNARNPLAEEARENPHRRKVASP